MTKTEIVNELAHNQTVEKIVFKLASYNFDTKSLSHYHHHLEDLVNDIYYIILEKDDSKIETLYERNELGFFIWKIVKNQLLSTHSPFYKNYISPSLKKANIEDIPDEQLNR